LAASGKSGLPAFAASSSISALAAGPDFTAAIGNGPFIIPPIYIANAAPKRPRLPSRAAQGRFALY
jgi:hypothetical protein